MLNSEHISNGLKILSNSPFQKIYRDQLNYSLNNRDLLKYYLKNQLNDELAAPSPDLNLLNEIYITNCFNDHLQNVIEDEKFSLNKEEEEAKEEPNFINLKILIENSIYNNSNRTKKNAILSFNELTRIKNNLLLTKNSKSLIVEKIKITKIFLNSLDENFTQQKDPKLIEIINKTKDTENYLYEELNSINEEIISINEILNNHYLTCLSLGYIQDIDIPIIETINNSNFKVMNSDEINNSFEKLFSHIVSLSIKKSINLPKPIQANGNPIINKILWTQECIDTILSESKDDENTLNDSFDDEMMPTNYKDEQINSYKLALDDLKFTHEYLTKEYEQQRENFNKILHKFQVKNSNLEKEVISINYQLDKNSKFILNQNLNFKEFEKILVDKDNEINKLRKELNFLRIDNLGHKNLSTPNLSEDKDKFPLSPINSEFNSPISPRLSNFDSGFNSNSNTSVGILRKEFKKLIDQIQNQFEIELQNERIEKKRLNNLLNFYQLDKIGLTNHNNFSENDDTLN